MSLPSTFFYPYRAFLLLGIFVLTASTAIAQERGEPDPCSGGTLYYVALPDTVTNRQDARFAANYPEEFFLYIYSPVDQQVRIGRSTGSPILKNIVAGDILEFDTREVAVPLISVRNSPQTNVLKIESESSVIIYAYMATRFGCAAFTPIPVGAWGKEYYAATWEGRFVRNIIPGGELQFNARTKVPAPAEILVIAAYDNTEVVITPTDSLASCAACRRVILNGGEAYLVQSVVDTGREMYDAQPDIAGTSIVADKPVGVVSGNTRTWHEPFDEGFLGANSFKDMVAEWLTPVEQHGKEFVFTPTWDIVAQRPDAQPVRDREYVRIYATTDELTYIEDSSSSDLLGIALSSGAFRHDVLHDLTNGLSYRSTEPAQAFQSPRPVGKFDGAPLGGGAGNIPGASYKSWGTYMVEMTPREQWTSFAPFKAPSYPSSMKHYINVVAERGDSGRISYRWGNTESRPFPFDHGTIRSGERTFVWGTMAVDPGLNYVIEGKEGARFGGFVYGTWTGYELHRPGGAEREEESKGRSTTSGHPSPSRESRPGSRPGLH